MLWRSIERGTAAIAQPIAQPIARPLRRRDSHSTPHSTSFNRTRRFNRKKILEKKLLLKLFCRIFFILILLRRVMNRPFGDAWLVLKQMRQTNLGEHHQDFPSPYGPVVAYHGTTGDNFMDIMGGAGLQNPDPNYATMSTNPSESASYAVQRSGNARNSPQNQSQPMMIAIRQAAFDQNHANYIGPSHGMKNPDDYAGAQHFGGNIPRQFLTYVPMSNEILGDTMQAREGRQDIIDRNMSYPAESQSHVRNRVQEMQNTPPTQFPIVNQRGEVRPKKPSNRMRFNSAGRERQKQRMNEYNQQMTQYMQPTPVQQPQDPYQTQLF